MDTQTFWRRVETLADEFNIGHHPFVQAVHQGRASRQQLRQFAIEHYEMTVRGFRSLHRPRLLQHGTAGRGRGRTDG
jgi:pyrroloquinoline quinone (PQQ) biosynthesis protein C